MSNDRYTGDTLADLRPTTPEDADGFSVDARALRQIKRFLKYSSGLQQTIVDIMTNNKTFIDQIKTQQRNFRNGQIIAIENTIDPNENDAFSGEWEKLEGKSVCGLGNATFNTWSFGEDTRGVSSWTSVPVDQFYFQPVSSYTSSTIDNGISVNGPQTPVDTSRLNVIIKTNFDVYNSLSIKCTCPPRIVKHIFIASYQTGCFYKTPTVHSGCDVAVYEGFSATNPNNKGKLLATQYVSANGTIELVISKESHLTACPYVVVAIGDPISRGLTSGTTIQFFRSSFLVRAFNGFNPVSPNYRLDWNLQADILGTGIFDNVTERHSNRTTRLLWRISNAGSSITVRNAFGSTRIPNLNNAKKIKIGIQRAWSIFAGNYVSNWPYFAFDGVSSRVFYNYKIKFTLSVNSRYDPDGIVLGELTPTEDNKAGIYLEADITPEMVSNGTYLVISLIPNDSSQVQLTGSSLWWIGDFSINVDISMDYESNNYSSFDLDNGKDIESSIPLKGVTFWRRISDGTERDSNTD